jgi:hypothetical protein
MPNQNKTDSLVFAAYLSCLGFEPADIVNLSSSSKFLFVFEMSDDDFKSHADFFWSRKTHVDALTYSESLKVLKSRIYQHKNQEKTYGRTI